MLMEITENTAGWVITAITGGCRRRAKGARGHDAAQQRANRLAQQVQPEGALRRAEEHQRRADQARRVDRCALHVHFERQSCVCESKLVHQQLLMPRRSLGSEGALCSEPHISTRCLDTMQSP